VSGGLGTLRRRAPIGGGPATANLLIIAALFGGPLVFVAVSYRFGPVMAVAVVAAPLLLVNARLTLLLAMSVFLIFEADPGWGLNPVAGKFYMGAPFMNPYELLLYLAFGAMLIDVWVNRRRFRLPDPFAAPLALIALAFLFGVINGAMSGQVEAFAVKSNVETIAPLFLIPIVVVNVLRTRKDLETALKVFAGVAIFKAILGLVVLAVKPGVSTPGVPPLTYYEPTTNWVTMVFLLAVLAAVLQRVKLSRWVIAGTPFVVACLLLSYRRTYWIATSLGLLIVLVLSSSRVGRRLIVPAAILVVAAGVLVYTSGAATDVQGPIVKRAQSLDPSKLKANEQDRYRLAERDNVIADLKEHPITGIGVGVPWTATKPLPWEFPIGRQYTHTAVLWFWLRMGILGAFAYLTLIGSAIWCGLWVWRRHPDPLVRVASLAAGIGVLGLAIVELASTVIGPDQRGTSLIGLVLGLLAVAYLQARAELATRRVSAPASPSRPRDREAIPAAGPNGAARRLPTRTGPRTRAPRRRDAPRAVS
jgi:O-antigen ligase